MSGVTQLTTELWWCSKPCSSEVYRPYIIAIIDTCDRFFWYFLFLLDISTKVTNQIDVHKTQLHGSVWIIKCIHIVNAYCIQRRILALENFNTTVININQQISTVNNKVIGQITGTNNVNHSSTLNMLFTKNSDYKIFPRTLTRLPPVWQINILKFVIKSVTRMLK